MNGSNGGPTMFQLSPENSQGVQRTLAEQVASELHRLILRGVLPAGSHLRIQELAERFDTSSMPVREALRKLAALGLVDLVPHRGARVRELSVDDLEDTYRARLALETLVVAEAAATFTEEQAAMAQEALARHETHLARGENDEARRAHTEFHFLLYQAAGSKWLLRAIEPGWQNSERYRFSHQHEDAYSDRSHEEHVELLNACRARDPRRAEEAMRVHLEGAMSRMRAAMTESGAER
ncbi:GntR family transcriptional regulator [Actinotalea sp. Marseille-Q4924]|uniref:GntR family transcriptional regulator n=1 Tax=Actinotalea sp. Marseille-Q4924 TaxID=2866571 RepID=UPI001CE3E752|nr:GntR family transcriptional regulator [Actinotalea sp. Marseille-Q4924]